MTNPPLAALAALAALARGYTSGLRFDHRYQSRMRQRQATLPAASLPMQPMAVAQACAYPQASGYPQGAGQPPMAVAQGTVVPQAGQPPMAMAQAVAMPM